MKNYVEQKYCDQCDKVFQELNDKGNHLQCPHVDHILWPMWWSISRTEWYGQPYTSPHVEYMHCNRCDKVPKGSHNGHVTIACEYDRMDAHRIILSAVSPFFQNVIKHNHQSIICDIYMYANCNYIST